MNWINWAWIGGGLLGSLIVGLIIGRIVAGIKYPNPDKPHIFTPKQSVIILVGVVVAVALIVFAMLYQPCLLYTSRSFSLPTKNVRISPERACPFYSRPLQQ